MIAKLLAALTLLGLGLIRHLLLFPFVRRRNLEQVMKSFRPDGVLSVSAAERALAPSMQRCNACGKCDVLGHDGLIPSLVIVSLGREAADAPLALPTALSLSAIAEQVAAICPEHVDLPALIERIKRQASAQEQA